ncbi:MAG TPA: hypothetical protein VNU44_02760 [Bryobacteraceae bacterium]|nr:hypothetical protein [Bryobacteraceae bacterium]
MSECVCPEKIARRRIEQGKNHPAKNRTVELYLKIRDEFGDGGDDGGG